MNLKKWFPKNLIPAAIVIAVAMFGAVVVSAQDFAPGGATRGERGMGQLQRGGERFPYLQDILAAISEQTGLSLIDVAAEVRGGTSLAALIEANDGSVEAISETVVAAVTERINQAVENGRISQERANEMLTDLGQGVTDAINSEIPLLNRGFGFGDRLRGQMNIRLDIIQLAAEQTGLTAREIAQQIWDGSSLEDILTANDITIDTFITDAVASAQARLSELVENGALTQEHADEVLSNFESHLMERLTVDGSA
jgi:hypothetical protein